MSRKENNPFIPLLIGGVIGSAAALLMSPASGRENRTFLNNSINRILYRANERKNILIRDARQIAKNAVIKAEDIYNKSLSFAEGKYSTSAESMELEIRSLRNAITAAAEAYKRNTTVGERRKLSKDVLVNENFTEFEDETLPKQEGMGRRTG
jgi:gas vesicle protein